MIEAVDKKRARLNCMAHLLTRVPYQEVPHQKPVLPARVHNPDYHRHPVPHEMYVPDHYASVRGRTCRADGGGGEEWRGGQGERGNVRTRCALCNRDIGARKIVALEQQGLARRLRKGVGETIAEIEPSRVAAAFAEIAIGGAGDFRLLAGINGAVRR